MIKIKKVNTISQNKRKQQTAKITEIAGTIKGIVVKKRTIKLEKFVVHRINNFLIFPYRNNDELNKDTLIIAGKGLYRPLVKVPQDKVFVSKLSGLDKIGYIYVGAFNVDYNIFIKDLKDLALYNKS